MGLFRNNKNANETAYVGGKKHWTDVIKNTGAGDLLIWRQPEEDFNTNSTLVVMPGEAAIFIDQGQIVQTFNKSGTYKLSTSNYPFITRLRTAFTGGISTFNCVVYFVRKAVSKELLWGTVNRIQVRDKIWKIRTDIGARGAFKVAVDNPEVFLTKLIGNNIPYQTQNELFDYFGEELQGKIVSTLSFFFNNQWPTELIGLEACLQDLAAFLKPQINEMFKDYGLRCESFVISGMPLDTTKYDQADEAQVQQNKMQILGENWARLTAAEILQTLAANPGAGGVAAAGAGLGMGMAAGGAFTNLASEMFKTFPGNIPTGTAPQPGIFDGGTRFEQADSPAAPHAGGSSGGGSPFEQAAPQPGPSAQSGGTTGSNFEAAKELKAMLDAGFITKEVYDAKISEIMSRM